jgi:hypothetical protein
MNCLSTFEHGDSYMPATFTYSTDLSGWHHYAISMASNTSGYAIYLDGSYIGNSTKTNRGTYFLTLDLIGGSSWGTYAGYMFEVAVYRYVLTQQQIQSHISCLQGSCCTPACPSNLTCIGINTCGVWEKPKIMSVNNLPTSGGTLIVQVSWYILLVDD